MRDYKEYTILDAKAATGEGVAIDVSDFRHLVVEFITDGGGDAALTVKFAGSIEDTMPSFDSAQALANMFDYIEVVDMQNGSAIDGDTGVSVATADDYRIFAVNCDGLKWFNAIVTARTAGEVTVKIKAFRD